MLVVGNIKGVNSISGDIRRGAALSGNISAGISIDKPAYAGPYTVEPEFESVTLETANKTMKENVTVEAITVSRTTNQSGGKTVYIGGNISA